MLFTGYSDMVVLHKLNGGDFKVGARSRTESWRIQSGAEFLIFRFQNGWFDGILVKIGVEMSTISLLLKSGGRCPLLPVSAATV